jgi:hypothetical protein
MAVTFTVQGKTPMANGLVRTRVKMVLDNNYPVAGYDVSTPASWGLSRFQLQATQDSFVDPVVTGVNQGGVMAEIKAMKLLLSYPSGGGQASPTTPAAPLLTAGAVAVTSNAANGANDLTPGVGKAFANASDASTLTVFADAVGYPA